MNGTPAAIVLLVLLLAGCGHDPPTPKITPSKRRVPSGWEGFRPGSWTVIQWKRAGQKGSKPFCMQKHILEETDSDGELTVRTEYRREGRDAFCDHEGARQLQPLTHGMTETARRRDNLAIGSETLDCTVVEYSNIEDRPQHVMGARISMAVWKADGVSLSPRVMWMEFFAKVPSDVVRVQRKKIIGSRIYRWDLTVMDLAAELDVDGQKVNCTIQEVLAKGTEGDLILNINRRRQWLCDSIPGGFAKRKYECRGRGGKGGGISLYEVKSFAALR